MAFNYPIQAPTDTCPMEMTLRYVGNTAVSTSPYTREQQTHTFDGDMWEAEFTLPPMNRENAEKWESFLTRLQGRAGTFYIDNPSAKQPKGSANGTPKYAPVANPPYVTFDGDNDYIDVGDNLDLSGDFTWEMWIYPKDISTSDQRLYVKHDEASNEGWYLSIGDGGKGEIRVQLEDLTQGQVDTGNILDERIWQHIAVTYDKSADTVTIYKNGEKEIDSTSVTGTLTSNTQKLGIGGDPEDNSGNSFDGIIDDVRHWSDVRTQKEIRDNLDNELVGNETDLKAYWKLDDADGDASEEVSNVSGTLNGDASWVPQASDKIMVKDWNADQTQALKAGDYIEINDEYKKVVEDVDSDARGNSTLFIQPSFRANPPDDESVTTDNPQLKMRLNEDQVEWNVETVIHDGITFAGREAF